jgi:hypothetical protein
MSNTNQPESAFPSTFKSLSPEEGQVHRWGMQLRDFFASKAMQSLIIVYGDDKSIVKEYAQRAYEIADAMMEARKE